MSQCTPSTTIKERKGNSIMRFSDWWPKNKNFIIKKIKEGGGDLQA
jgi:hypothetical protein